MALSERPHALPVTLLLLQYPRLLVRGDQLVRCSYAPDHQFSVSDDVGYHILTGRVRSVNT